MAARDEKAPKPPRKPPGPKPPRMPRAPKPPPDPTKLKREAAGRYVSGDGRFTVEQGSGGWMVLDAEQTNEFGLPLARGPFAGLDGARASMDAARSGPAPTSALAEKIAKLPKRPAQPPTRRASSAATPAAPEVAPAPPPPPPVEIREYRSGDGEGLRALWKIAGFDSPGDDDKGLRRFAQHNAGMFLVAVQGATVVGSAMGGWDGRRGWIYHVATAPEHRREGLATRMVRQIEDRLRTLGSPRANAIVLEDNDEAIRFWESLGYGDRKSRQYGRDLD